MTDLEMRIREILADPEIMKFSAAAYESTLASLKGSIWRDVVKDDGGPCTHDDDLLCGHRITALARKIVQEVERR